MNSTEYWKKREAENLVRELKEEAAYSKELDRIYKDMLDGCQKEIDSFYGRYADKEGITIAEAKKRVSQLDIEAYERKAKRYVKDKDFSKQANEEMRLYNATMKINRLEMLKANIGLELIKGHEELNTFMGKILKGRTEAELKRQAGILGKTVRNNAKLANAIVNGSHENATFSQRIWGYQGQMRSDLSKLLEQGLIQGKNARVLAKEMKKYFIGNEKKVGGAQYNAERLMRTELARVQTEAQKQSFIANGFKEYTFIVNAGCCDVCAGIAGKHFKVSKLMPGENAPPMHPFCRCSIAAYEDSDEYEAWLNYLDKGGTTAEWEKLSAKEKENYKNVVETKAAKEDASAPQKAETENRTTKAKAQSNGGNESPEELATKALRKAYDDRIEKQGVNFVPSSELNEKTLERMSVNLTGMAKRLAKDTAEQFAKLANKYHTTCQGINVGIVDNIGAPADTSFAANISSSHITFSKAIMKDYDSFAKRMENAVERGQFLKMDASNYGKYIVTHEFFHTLMDFNSTMKNPVNAPTAHIRKARQEIKEIQERYKEDWRQLAIAQKEAERKALETLDEAAWKKAGELTEELKANTISNYADMSIDEFAAEAFADALLGSNPTKYSLEVLAVIDKYFKK